MQPLTEQEARERTERLQEQQCDVLPDLALQLGAATAARVAAPLAGGLDD